MVVRVLRLLKTGCTIFQGVFLNRKAVKAYSDRALLCFLRPGGNLGLYLQNRSSYGHQNYTYAKETNKFYSLKQSINRVAKCLLALTGQV